METKSERNRKRQKTRRVTRSRNVSQALQSVCVWGGRALKSGPKSGSVGPLGRSVWGPSALQRPISKRRFKERVEDAGRREVGVKPEFPLWRGVGETRPRRRARERPAPVPAPALRTRVEVDAASGISGELVQSELRRKPLFLLTVLGVTGGREVWRGGVE